MLNLAFSERPLASTITMSVLMDGSVHLSAAGVEVEHARSFLIELDSMRDQLQTFVASNERRGSARVIRFPV